MLFSRFLSWSLASITLPNQYPHSALLPNPPPRGCGAERAT